MRAARRVACAAVVLGGMLAARSAAADQPLVPQLSYCVPRYPGCPGGTPRSQCPLLKTGYVGPGYGNDSNSRTMEVGLAYVTASPTDSRQKAIDLTARVELCKVAANGAVDCPGTAPWVVLDRPAGMGIPNEADVFKKIEDAYVNVTTFVPYIWDDPVEGQHLVLRVNGAVWDAKTAASTYGACANWRTLATDGRFDVTGVDPTTNPFASSFDVCTDGSRVDWANGGPTGGRDVCLRGDHPGYLLGILASEHLGHHDRIQLALPSAERILSWVNGTGAGQTLRPMHVFLGPHLGKGGAWDWGAYRMNVDDLHAMSPGLPPQAAITGNARAALRLVSHEYFHSLQDAWGRERPASDPHVNGYITEGLTQSVELNLCLTQFPNAPADECVSPGKLGLASKGVYSGVSVLDSPSLNVLQRGYGSSIFWRYLVEQFSYPTNTTAHPSDEASSFERPPNADTKPLQDRPDSDEGIDFIGLLFKDFGGSAVNQSTTNVLDKSLGKHLGRSLEQVMLDFHTALVLKDYSDDDPRWRLEWTHGGGYAATTRLGDAKPFAPSPDLYGQTCGTASGTSVCDGLTRARRLHDSWQPGVTAAVPLTIPLTQTVSSPQPAGIGRFGAAYVSLRPDTSSIQPGQPVSAVLARVKLLSTYAPANLRLLRIREDASGALLAEPLCGAPPESSCAVTLTGFGEWTMSHSIPVTADTRELLLVVSGNAEPQSFTWSFGPVQPTLAIIEPTQAVKGFVGYAGPTRRSFLVKLAYRDADDKPLSITSKSMVTLRIHACKDQLSTCTLGPKDFGLQGFSGGVHLLTVTLPDEVYPKVPDGEMGLEVSVQASTALEPAALQFAQGLLGEALVLSIDKSSAMSSVTFPLAKFVAKAIAQSLLPPPGAIAVGRFGVVSFDEDADTATLAGEPLPSATTATYAELEQAIDALALAPGSGPSLGDGLFEAQSVLAAAFDALPNHGANVRQSILIVSAGSQVNEYDPWRYFVAATPTPNDGRGAPWTQPVSRPLRVGGLVAPRISTVAIGPDADLSQLDLIARLGDGTRLLVPGLAGSMIKAKLDFVDTMECAFGMLAGYDRVRSARTRGEPVSFQLEPDALELRVTASSELVGGALGTLRTPSGAGLAPSASSARGDAVTYRVLEPEPGTWQLEATGEFDVEEPVLFVEASVRAPLQLFTAVDAALLARPVPTPDGGLPERLSPTVGRDVVIRATPWEAGPVTDCELAASVVLPDGVTTRTLALHDDGRHQDELAGDGVFGAVLAETGQPGYVQVRVHALCTSPSSGAAVEREKLEAVVLKPLPDLDGNGLPDEWETAWGLGGSPAEDADGDGLVNGAELLAGTSPRASDSDGGGEADGSELASGRDPRDPADDAVSTPEVVPIAGNGVVYLPAAMGGSGVRLEVEKAAAPEGPFTPLPAAGAEDASETFDAEAGNSEQACYRVRAVTASATSGWSAPACVTPRVDPTPPRVDVLDAPSATPTRDVRLKLAIDDPVSERDGPGVPDLGIVASGVTGLRFWFGAGPPDGVQWLPPSSELELRLPDQDATYLRLQARDLAGNLSEPVGVVITRPRATALGRAIALEERAEDLIALGDLAGAKAALLESILETKQAHTAAVLLVVKTKGKSAAAVFAVKTLGKVLGLKAKALALMKPPTQDLAIEALTAALELELAVAAAAEAEGVTL